MHYTSLSNDCYDFLCLLMYNNEGNQLCLFFLVFLRSLLFVSSRMLSAHVDSDSFISPPPGDHQISHVTNKNSHRNDNHTKSTLSSRHRKKSLMINTTFNPTSILSTNLTNIITKLTNLLDRLVTTATSDDSAIVDEEKELAGCLLSREEIFDVYWMQWMHFRKHPLWTHHKDLLDSYIKKHVSACVEHLYNQSMNKSRLREIVKVLEEDIKSVTTKEIKLNVTTKLLGFAHSKAVWDADQCTLFVKSISIRDEGLDELIQKLRKREEETGSIFERFKGWMKELKCLASNINIISVGSTIGVLALILGILYSRNRRRHLLN